jgi:hypothetical protein
MDSASPLAGWDLTSVFASGKRHGVDRNDVYGCLFFHVRDELREFGRRVRDFNIDFHLTQLPASGLSRGIRMGVFPPFHLGCFDRVETSNMVDSFGVATVLSDWAPLMNRQNEYATLLMYFMNWSMKPRLEIEPTPGILKRVAQMEVGFYQ